MFSESITKNAVKTWITKAGYKAVVVAYPVGHRCGYVELPKNHPAVGYEYGDLDIAVHGGLTYGEGNVFGFDCAHYGDGQDVTIMDEKHKELYYKYCEDLLTTGTIKTTEYCVAECEAMATQFKLMEV